MKKKDNKAILNDTLQAFERRMYLKNGVRKGIKLSYQEMMDCQVYLPEQVKEICTTLKEKEMNDQPEMSCTNIDSFSMARTYEDSVLVLNLANSVHPGGGVRYGARAQEEDLCRKSSLLISLESDNAYPYYKYNRQLETNMGSHGIIITPKVEIIKDENNEYLEDSQIVSVMTCAAPCLSHGLEGLSFEQYLTMMEERIEGMLKVAEYLGYEHLVLGAFGCGAFDNDARLVSDIFYKALQTFKYSFKTIDFAVLDRTRNQYNYKEFSRNFNR